MSKVHNALKKAEREPQGTPQKGNLATDVLPGILPHLSEEALRELHRLQSNIEFADGNKPLKTIMVTSSVPGEGSSTVAVELALSISSTEATSEDGVRTVLLLDGNLRTPSLHSLFGLANGKGLAQLVMDDLDPGLALRDTRRESLKLITCGQPPANPTWLLGSQRTKGLIESLRQRFDYVILDSAPVVSYPDSVALSRYVDGVILVVRAGKTRWEIVQKGQAAMEKAGANILGVVLNRRKFAIPEAVYRRL